jgi:hypothetical protein
MYMGFREGGIVVEAGARLNCEDGPRPETLGLKWLKIHATLGPMSEEKRKFLRFECLVPVELVKVEKPAAKRGEAVIENVSREGLRVVLDLGGDLQPGADLQFKMHSPERGRSCSLKGQVIWAKAKGGKVEVGLRISNADDCAKAELLEIGYDQWRKDKGKAQARASK